MTKTGKSDLAGNGLVNAAHNITAMGFCCLLFVVLQAGYYAIPTDIPEALKDAPADAILQYSTNYTDWVGTLATAFSCVIVALNLKVAIAGFKAYPTFFLSCLLVAVTSLYSHVVGDSLFYAAKATLYLVAIYVAMQKTTIQKSQNYLAVFTLFIVIASVILGKFVSGFGGGVDNTVGIRGLFLTKNGLGGFCFWMFNILFMMSRLKNHGRVWLSRCAMIMCALCLSISASKTPLALLILEMGLWALLIPASRFLNRQMLSAAIAVLILTAGGLALAYILPKAMSGELTFTGRTVIWGKTLDFLGDRILFGMGGASSSLDPDAKDTLLRAHAVTAIDSSYVVLLFNNGWLGVVCYTLFMIAQIREIYSAKRDAIYLSYIIILFAYTIYGFTESSYGLNIKTGLALLLVLNIVFNTDRSAKKKPRIRVRPRFGTLSRRQVRQ